MSGKKIENDEQYNKSLEWLVKTAIELEDPLLDGPERTKKQAIYDHVSELVQRYRRGGLVQKFPGLREIYAKLGWNYDDDGPKDEQVSAQSEPISSEWLEDLPEEPESDESETLQEPEPETDPEPEPQSETVDLSAWLDDD